MAFQNLKTGNTVYIFRKGNLPELEIGQIMSEPKIRQKYQMPSAAQPYSAMSFMPQQGEQVVDLSIKIGEKVQPIEGLCPVLDIQDCGNGLFVSCSRDAINAEIATYMHNSEMAITDETINAHKHIVECCKAIMVKLNPEIAERQRIEEENKELKSELREMKDMMTRLLEQLEGPVKK